MKFLCGSCRTKYQISDEKVRGKILTIRCKKCGAKILVRESLSKNAGGGTAVAPVAEEEQPKAAEISGKKSVSVAAKAGGSAALASAFEVAMGGGTSEADDMPTSIAPVPANLDNAGVEWYVAIDGEQFGPYAFAELVRRIVSKEVIGRHYCWHDGMDNWLRVRDVKDLAPYLPSDKKKPPPPPPPVSGEHKHQGLEDPTIAAGGAEIVDLSLRRAERNRTKSPKLDRAEDDTKPDAPKADERAEQLDSVLNEALGIEGEGRTTRAEPERAIAVSGTARTKEGHAEPSIDDLLAFEEKDDLFANVPRATDADLVRESTRFFVAAAGMNARKSKHKIAMVLAGVVVMMLVGFIGAWAGGIIRIELPGIGNPFAGPSGKSLFASADEEVGEEEDPEAIGRMLTEEERRARKKKRQRRSKGAGSGGYIEDSESSGRAGTRGGEVGSLDLELGSGGLGIGKLPESKLPSSGIDTVPVDQGGASLSADVIKRVVDQRKRSVLICYQQSLKGQEDLRGKLEIRVTVAPSGEVKSAVVETSAFKGSKLGRCIASKIQDWRFPSFSGEAQQILVPFVLEKGNDY
jgi:predicted Zn finger-like uncharacterized protein